MSSQSNPFLVMGQPLQPLYAQSLYSAARAATIAVTTPNSMAITSPATRCLGRLLSVIHLKYFFISIKFYLSKNRANLEFTFLENGHLFPKSAGVSPHLRLSQCRISIVSTSVASTRRNSSAFFSSLLRLFEAVDLALNQSIAVWESV